MKTIEKTKKTFTALDTTAIVNDLKEKILGLRVVNIFDINPKTYLFKFAKNEKKEVLIIESGLRIHTTASKIEKSKIPSGFTMKFRKFLRAKKLEKIEQIGCERVVDMQFGSDNAFHLLLEFYSQGNIILTDKDYVVLQLIRSHSFTETNKTALGERYPFEFAAKLSLDKFDLSIETISSYLKKQPENQSIQENGENQENQESQEFQEIKKIKEEKQKKKVKSQTKPQPAPSATKKFKDVLFQILPCLNPALTDHLLKANNVNPNNKCSIKDLEQLKKIAEFSLSFLQDFSKKRHKGYLVLSSTCEEEKKEEKQEEKKEFEEKKEEKEEISLDKKAEKDHKKELVSDEKKSEKKPTLSFVDFAPCLFLQNEDKRLKIYDTFNEALDDYFSAMETKSERVEFEQKAWKKFENIKQDQENRLEILKSEQEDFLVKANLIEKNIKDIEAIINIIKTMVDSGLSWDKITKMINESKKNGDMLANLIYATDWEQDEVVILLADPEHEDLEAELTPVQINFTVSAFQNAKLYYENKKKHCVKEKKTMEASQQALKIAEKNALQEIIKIKEKIDVLNARKTYWFEKFYWFISSENYMVLCGRDGQQNELLVKKYLMKGDVYMHADYHGAATVVVKNLNRGEPIPITTLEESAVYAAARSKAWDSKILPGTWWVYDHQVSKSAPSGEYLPTGSFMIRGKKNFINPPKLELGMGFLFKIDESCLEAHLNDRRVKKFAFDEEKKEEEIQEIQEIGEKVKEKEEFTLVTMGDLQPRIKNIEKKPKNIVKNDSNIPVKTVEKEIKVVEKKEFEEKNEGNKKIQAKNLYEVFDLLAFLCHFIKNSKDLPRGKKSKMKKMKERYEEQDEEERQIKMKLIGASEMKIGKQDKIEKIVCEEEKNVHKGKKNKKEKKEKKGGKKMEDYVPVKHEIPAEKKEVLVSEIDKNETKGDNVNGENFKGENFKRETLKGENVKGENVKGENVKGENVKDENVKGETHKGENVKGKTPRGDTHRGDTHKVDAHRGKTHKKEANKGEGKKEEIVKNEVKKEEIIKKEVNKEEINKEKIIKEEINKEKIIKKEVNKEEINKEKIIKEEITKEEINQEEINQEEAIKENKPENFAEENVEEIEIKEDGNEDQIEEELEKQRLNDEETQEKNLENPINLDKTEWNCLVGHPLSEDTYFNIVPVCAPMASLINYKYKIKLVPGQLKKGKAAKTISSYFLGQKDLNIIDKKLIRGLTDFDLINDLIGGVKLVGSGVQKIRAQEKKSKKEKKK